MGDWAEQVAEYGVDYAFDIAIMAAQQGWDHPLLRRAPQGEPAGTEDWKLSPHFSAQHLTTARLNVLERQGCHQEYLQLAAAQGWTAHYAVMLARLGRVDDAVDYGLHHLETAEEAYALATVLLDGDYADEAIRIGENGMTLAGSHLELAFWLRDLAIALGRSEQALPVAVIAFQSQPILNSYLMVRELAGNDWPAYRADLLAALRQSAHLNAHDAVDIFLHEGLIDDAINAVDRGWPPYALIERVAEAATTTHPDWAIRTSRRQAESIMNQGRCQHYHHAVRWLIHARAAYRALGQDAEWIAYLASLIDLHQPKYKLRAMLEALKN